MREQRNGATLEECAQEIGVSKQACMVLERKAIEKIKRAVLARFGEEALRDLMHASQQRESSWDRIARG